MVLADIKYLDVIGDTYKISDDASIYRHGKRMNMDNILYKSSNGNIYVHLESINGFPKLYQLDLIMIYSMFGYDSNKDKNLIAIHIDGDRNNCNLSNLIPTYDVESLMPIDFDSKISNEKYMISSHGRAFDVSRRKFLTQHLSLGYPQSSFNPPNGCNKRSSVCRKLHRYVAKMFVNNPNKDEYNDVNHIDGDKTNNNKQNLEWLSHTLNMQHAINEGLLLHKCIPANQQDMIRDMLLDERYRGSEYTIYRIIDHNKYPDITIDTIIGIRENKLNVFRLTERFDLDSLHFIHNKKPCRVKKDKRAIISRKHHTEDEVNLIVEMLLDEKYNGSPTLVFSDINKEQYPNITLGTVKNVKAKRPNFIRLSTKYDLQNLEFIKIR